MKRRVVVTGLGTVNPAGNDIPSFWKSIKEGKTGIGPITLFDSEGYAAKVAGEVKDFDQTKYIDRKEARKMARFTVFAVAAAVLLKHPNILFAIHIFKLSHSVTPL